MKNTFHAAWIIALFLAVNAEITSADTDLTELNIEELLSVKITSVSKKSQALGDAAAAVFVISNDDIKRSGATSIPDALRLAPGIDVGRIDANKWAVSSRGFNGRFSNKLLVLIDGRNIYTPAFSGVYWEMQDVMLEDVERIEVIRGSGAALWGANAVNGVINIITKHSADTQGGLLSAGGGSEERGFGSFRYGGKLNEDTSGRAYVKGFERDALSNANGQPAGDAWSKMQGGFRIDSDWSAADTATVQGDVYHSNLNQHIGLASLTAPYRETINDQVQASGGNLLGRLQHHISDTSNYALQVYFDSYDRRESFIEEERYTGDVDFQHRFAFNDWNDIIWGAGYRYTYTKENQVKQSIVNFNPPQRGESYFSTFVQDQLTLIDEQLWLTLGSKLEHNDYTGIEVQPTARLLWGPDPNHRLWAAVSRGVRIPSRVDAHMELIGQVAPPLTGPNSAPLPLALAVTGSNAFRSEEVLACETGYRYTPDNSFSLDISLFYNDYQNLRSYAAGNLDTTNLPFFIKQPFVVDNAGKGHTYGAETALVWKMLDWWRWDLSYSVLKTELTSNQYYQEAVSPQHKTSLRAMLNPAPDITLDAWLRYVDNTSAFTLLGPAYIKSYTTLDLRLAWQLNKAVELSVVGQNLLDNQHLGYIQETFTQPTELQRGVYGKLVWAF